MSKLAIEGGKPLRTKPFPSKKGMGKEELNLLTKVIESGFLFRYNGKMVKTFEEEFALTYGIKEAIACTSGTAAIHIALGAINPEPGDEIITSPITDLGTVIPILFQNCIPVFADVDKDTYNLKAEEIEKKITEKTRAIIVVHLFGQPAPVDKILKVARRHNLYLIEDCAQAHLASYKDRLVGTWGDIGCFSLQQSKHITTGDGGITITNNSRLAKRAKLFSDKCYSRDGSSRDPYFLGLNYRMTELQGAVALAQLKKVKGIVKRRRRVAKLLTSGLSKLKGVNPPRILEGAVSSYLLYPLTIDEKRLGRTTSNFVKALSREGIPASNSYAGGKPVYLYKIFQRKATYGKSHCPFDCPRYGKKIEYKKGLCPQAEEALKRLILLPCNEFFTQKDIEDIVRGVEKVAKHPR